MKLTEMNAIPGDMFRAETLVSPVLAVQDTDCVKFLHLGSMYLFTAEEMDDWVRTDFVKVGTDRDLSWAV